jgi:Fe-S-cluster containining protein
LNIGNLILKDCNQCGKCCIKYGDGGIEASSEDITMWEIFRPHIYKYVHHDKIWFDPQSKKQLTQCPFLEVIPNQAISAQVKYSCAIYEDRPEDCRDYPSSITEMVRDDCEMIEASDLIQVRKRK